MALFREREYIVVTSGSLDIGGKQHPQGTMLDAGIFDGPTLEWLIETRSVRWATPNDFNDGAEAQHGIQAATSSEGDADGNDDATGPGTAQKGHKQRKG